MNPEAQSEDPERRLFDQALDLPPGPKRDAWLADSCGGDASLEARVRALLNAHEDETSFLSDKSPANRSAAPELSGSMVGNYKLREQIGEGGFGTVWVADQERPVRRRVALKIIKVGMDTKEVIARFEQERQALAMMDHPNIAKVLDAGATESGRPFFVMELVRGIQITDYCDQNNLPTEVRLELFAKVCAAVQHAHQKGLMFVSHDSGGMFALGHLWFLYYLLWLYVLILGLRWLLTRSAPVAQRLRIVADGCVRRAMRSPWSLVWLSLGMGLFLWPMRGWFGVDAPKGTLVPSLAVQLLYGGFFSFGWLLHRQAELLRDTSRHWRWQLPLAVALSIPLFAVYQSIRDRGIGSDSHPTLTTTQIIDWPAFIDHLKAAEKPDAVAVELANLWAHVPPATRRTILSLTGDATADQSTGVSQVIGKLMIQPAMFQAAAIPAGFKPSPEETDRALKINRAKLEQLFPGAPAGDPNALAWYQPAKLAHSMGYALVMWLLIFGTLGFFQSCCPGHSPAWRYVADSSYWIYLAHLPLVGALQIWMAAWPWPGAVKFLLLNATAFAILFASYHYLVRSTFIGRILNGRAHPFVAWPFAASARQFSPLRQEIAQK